MENRSHALMTGFFTLALLLGAILAASWLSQDRIEWIPYEIATKLSVPGLRQQAVVRYRGLEVGKVDSISFDPQVTGQILIRMRISPQAPVTHSTFATLSYQGVTGIASVQLDDDGSARSRLPSSAAAVARISLRPSLLDQLESRGSAILVQAQEMTRRFNHLLDPVNQNGLIAAIDHVNKTAAGFEKIPLQLAPTLNSLPAVSAQAMKSLAAFQQFSQDASALTRRWDELAARLQASDGPLLKMASTLEQVSGTVGRVAGGIERETLPRLNALTEETRSSVRALHRAIDSLSEHPQSLLYGAPGMAPGPGEAGFNPSGNQ